MRVFTRVVDEGGFAAAARGMNLSPAVVTRLVADLEDHLGTRLLNRTTRRIALTSAGELYLARVRLILTDLEEAEALASASTSEPRGHLRVLTPPAFAVHQLAKHLPRFRAMYPYVTLELSAPGPIETVDDNYDVSIVMTYRRPLDGDFIARRIAVSESIICAAPEYLARRGTPLLPRDLQQHDTLLPPFLRGELAMQTPPVDGAPGETCTLTLPRPALETMHIDTIYATTLAGMGIAGLPSFVVEDALLEHALERVLPQWQLRTSTFYAAMPSRKHVPARTRAFSDFLVDTFGGTDRDPWLLAAQCETLR